MTPGSGVAGTRSGPEYGPAWSASLRRGSDAELRGWVETALAWCDAADAVALRHFRKNPVTTRKPDRSFVTEADTAVERLLRERIADAFPDHGVVGEEFGVDGGAAAVRWFVDPIDGTHNFMRGVPVFATLLGVERDGELQAGIVSAPAMGGRWYAWRGGGAWGVGPLAGLDRRGAPRRLRVTGIADLAEAQVVYAGTQDVIASGEAPGFERLIGAAWRERGFGDFWGYSLVAEGAAEVMVEVGLSIWDAAAPVVLVEEAGGRVTDFLGRRVFDGGTTLATNGVLHETVRSILTAG
ncbi:MAG TPA: inositol monophosphatase family protein [Candidatus Sulfomarinibacteraceae bacterium]|nr:inositol monophosphatase family protein [Candidatus Sulfomarinibacteraceae bacterium]